MPRKDDEKTVRMPAVEDPEGIPEDATWKISPGTVRGRPPRESIVTKTEIILPSDANALGTVFGGRVMEWIDIAGAIAAGRHCRRTVVTASMDDLHFLAPIKVGEVVVVNAQVNYTSNTSLEVGVEVFSEHRETGERKRCCQAWLTFVALDDRGKPTAVPPLLPETTEEKRRFEEAEERRRFRLERRNRFR